ncbi:hypothetical protein [Pectobacterium aquaticum]|uniref:hypothetical protein n=1 Tax=Pectobacterium aquaticum TaxID=2204145 RepID=UPI001F10E259|nr:hypothetical protein [Pectobacterium aquaticum]
MINTCFANKRATSNRFTNKRFSAKKRLPRPSNLTYAQQFYTISVLFFYQPFVSSTLVDVVLFILSMLFLSRPVAGFFAPHLAFFACSLAGCHFFLQPKTTQIKTKDVDPKTTIVLNRHMAAGHPCKGNNSVFTSVTTHITIG